MVIRVSSNQSVEKDIANQKRLMVEKIENYFSY